MVYLLLDLSATSPVLFSLSSMPLICFSLAPRFLASDENDVMIWPRFTSTPCHLPSSDRAFISIHIQALTINGLSNHSQSTILLLILIHPFISSPPYN